MHSLSNYSASIPPVSLRTPPPFTQGRLCCPAAPRVRWNIIVFCQENGLPPQCEHWLAMTRRPLAGVVQEPLRRFAPPPLTGEPRSAPHKFPLKGGCPARGRGFNRGGLKPVATPDKTNRFTKGNAPQEDFLRCCCAPPPGAVGTKRRRTSGRERSFGNEFQRG